MVMSLIDVLRCRLIFSWGPRMFYGWTIETGMINITIYVRVFASVFLIVIAICMIFDLWVNVRYEVSDGKII